MRMTLSELLEEKNQSYSAVRGNGTKANVAFVKLFGIEPNFYKRFFKRAKGKSDPITIEQIAFILRNRNLVRDKEALEKAKYLIEGKPKPTFFIGVREGGWTILNDRQYLFVETNKKELYQLEPEHYVAPNFALG